MTVVSALRKKIAKHLIVSDCDALSAFECDGLLAYRQKPLAVVLVENIEQIKTVFEIAKKHQVPIVTRGSGTGLSGGSLPLANGIVLAMSKLNRIIDINATERTATVEPGVRNLAISEAVAPHKLYYAPDPSSQIICSIGGNVAENAGGVHCLKYGLTIHNVLAIKVMTIDGELLTLSRESDGLDLLSLFIGSEGLLGVVTEITVKLQAKPKKTTLLMAAFSSVEICADAVAEIIKQGVIPAGLEMMDALAISAAEDFAQVGYPRHAKALLLCELDGSEKSVKQETLKVKKIFSQAIELLEAKDETQRLALWQGRKAAFPAIGRLSPDYYCIDGTIPRGEVAFVLKKIEKLSRQYQLRVANVFHAGDGNLHPLIMYDASEKGALEKAEKLGNAILKLCLDVGGTITGEHGVGVEKLEAMCYQFPEAELSIFHHLKAVFDPENLLNPGKAIPTLNRCAEFGHMHVHHNQLPHPNLERF